MFIFKSVDKHQPVLLASIVLLEAFFTGNTGWLNMQKVCVPLSQLYNLVI